MRRSQRSGRRVLVGLLLTGAMSLAAIPVASAAQAKNADEPGRTCSRFDRAHFSDPTTIDYRFYPIVPGTRMVWSGTVDEEGGLVAHTVVMTVTDLTKVVDGVRTVVVWDRDLSDGELVETELAFFAQDDAGNVWNLGEYPEEFEEGEFVGAPSTWIQGVAGARGGIHVQGRPRVDTPAYVMGRAPSVEFFDKARVARMGVRTCSRVGCYRGVLVIDEWAPLDQPDDGHQLKYYAPGVGVVRIEAVGGEDQETLRLTRVERLTAAELTAARQQALRLDRRAYRVVPRVYGRTPPAERAR